jgi:D-alanyl-D-alanine carboxypeptidase (penicillin-binding protein 5/6)
MHIGFGLAFLLMLVSAGAVPAAPVSRDPYIGAIVVDADSGEELFAQNADQTCHPASVLKLMDLLIILEKIQSGAVKLEDPVPVTAEASRTGGSQVYLKEGEVFTVDEMLYALMVQSANDAAVALAIKLAGSKEGFVGLMNERAAQLGMKSTRFASVHGLPPGAGQQPDVTTARDLAILCRELAKHPETFRYTSTRERPFRPQAKEPFIMRTHNHLLLDGFSGCDGFKTGYYRDAGYSMAATAKRNDIRLIAVVVGSVSRETRDTKAKELLARGFLVAKPKPPPPPPAPTNAPASNVVAEVDAEIARAAGAGRTVWLVIVGIVLGAAAVAGGTYVVLRRRKREDREANFIRRT